MTSAPIPVYLLAGQSNMDGRGDGAALPPTLAAIPTGIAYRCVDPRSGQVVATAGMLGIEGKSAGRFGPHAAFIHALAVARPGQPALVIKSAEGGTRIDQWIGADGSGDGLYAGMWRGVRALLAGRAVRFQAFCWLQGESDRDGTAERYLAQFQALCRLVRRDTGEPGLPVIAAEPADGTCVIAALERAAEMDPGVRIVRCQELPHQDPQHYEAAGVVEIGRRLWGVVEMAHRG